MKSKPKTGPETQTAGLPSEFVEAVVRGCGARLYPEIPAPAEFKTTHLTLWQRDIVTFLSIASLAGKFKKNGTLRGRANITALGALITMIVRWPEQCERLLESGPYLLLQALGKGEAIEVRKTEEPQAPGVH